MITAAQRKDKDRSMKAEVDFSLLPFRFWLHIFPLYFPFDSTRGNNIYGEQKEKAKP
jgi:hypothetical protein